MKDFKGKVAVITGGAGGIGRAAGAMFAAEGADVLLVDMDAGSLEEAVKEILRVQAEQAAKMESVFWGAAEVR